MATHFSVLAWRIPGTGEAGGLPSMGSHRVGHDWSDLAVAAMVMLNIVKFDKNSDLLKKSKDLATLRPYQLCDNFGRVISTGSASIRLPDGSVVKPPPASAGDTRDTGLIPGSGRSLGGGNGNPTLVFLSWESHGLRSLVGYSPWGHKESDTTLKMCAYMLSCVRLLKAVFLHTERLQTSLSWVS